jgi:hypothetical protein
MRRSLGLLTATVAAVCAVVSLPVVALADGPKPAVESEAASHLATTDATLEAQINPGSGEDGVSLATTYEFFLETPWCGTYGPGACEASGGVLVYKGTLPAGSTPQVVSVDLASVGHTLSPGTTYGYRVVATNEAGEAFGGIRAFTTPAATAPAVEAESDSHVTRNDATLEATLNTEGLPYGDYYQFQIAANPDELLPELVCSEWGKVQPPGYNGCLAPGKWPSGAIPLGAIFGPAGSQSVHLDLASVGVQLKPGTTYTYRVLIARRKLTEDTISWESPAVVGSEETLTTLPAGKAPVIEAASVSHLTKTDATLEATIDTEGLETGYAFHLWSSPCSKKGSGCELVIPIKLPCSGELLGSYVPQTVSLDLNSVGVVLGEGEYGITVTASNEEGEASASGGVFEAPEEVAVPVKEPLAGPLGSPHGSSAGQSAASGGQGAGGQTPSSSTSTTGGSHGGATADLDPTRAEKAKTHKPKHKKHKPHKAKNKAHTGRRR